jgi:hypothetical protein
MLTGCTKLLSLGLIVSSDRTRCVKMGTDVGVIHSHLRTHQRYGELFHLNQVGQLKLQKAIPQGQLELGILVNIPKVVPRGELVARSTNIVGIPKGIPLA